MFAENRLIICEMYLSDEFSKQLSVFLRFFEVLACTYAVLRNAARCSFVLKNEQYNVVLSSILVVLATLTTILFYISVSPFVFCKIIATLILGIRYKENFGGLLKGPDVIWTVLDRGSNTIVTYLLIIEFADTGKGEFLEYVREVCAKRFFRSARLTCVRRNFMGYTFLVKNQLTVDDVVRELPALQVSGKTIQDYCNKPLPKNNTAAWELLVGTQPINSENEPNQYPLLIRIHHSIADGMTFLSLLTKQISDESVSVPNVPKIESARGVNSFLGGIKDFARLESRLVLPLHPADANVLHKSDLSGRKRAGFYVERQRRYLKVVKRIKGRVERASFSSVILTAISASLDDHLKKKAQSRPEDLTLTMMIVDRDALNFDHPELSNIYSMGSIKLPIAFHQNEMLFQRFLKVQRAHSELTQSHDVRINHCFFHVCCDLFPAPLLHTLVRMGDVPTIGFSNLPGFQKIHIGGHALRNLVFWVPNYLSIGVGFSLITYDDKFQMGLVVDEVIIPGEDDVQEILDGVLKYLDRMDEEFV